MVPELLTDEDHGIKLVLESRCVPGGPLHQAAPHATPKCFQRLQSITLEHVVTMRTVCPVHWHVHLLEHYAAYVSIVILDFNQHIQPFPPTTQSLCCEQEAGRSHVM